MVAERRNFFLGALPGRSGRLPAFLRTYARPCRGLGPAVWCRSRLLGRPCVRAAPSKFHCQMHLLKLALYEKTNVLLYFCQNPICVCFRFSSLGRLVGSWKLQRNNKTYGLFTYVCNGRVLPEGPQVPRVMQKY